jgi:alkylhydroperoxidase family enzyme
VAPGSVRRIDDRYDTALARLRDSARPGRPVPPAASAYAEKVRHRAYTVTDGDLAELRDAGLSEDEIFELTVSVAVDVGLERLAAGLRSLA